MIDPYNNLVELLLTHKKARPNKPALQYISGDKYKPITYNQLYQCVVSLAKELATSYMVKAGDHVAILSENRPEWVVADFATLALSAINIPVYPTLKSSEILEIFQNAKPMGVFISTEEQYAKIMEIKHKCPFIKWIIAFDPIKTLPHQNIAELLSFAHDIKGHDESAFEVAVSKIQRDTMASIVYTSGSTGLFKGVVLSHGNFLSNVEDITASLQIDDTERVLSFLPLCHTFERTAGYYTLLFLGATIYYATNISTISKDIQLAKPTVIICVPRIFEKMQNQIYSQLSGLKKLIFMWARYVHRVNKPNSLQYKLAQRLVYSKINEKLGGHLRFCVCGGAPLAQELGVFFQELGITILEGYGLTETSPVLAFNRLGAMRFGTVGQALPRVQVSQWEDGELLVKGPNIMKQYYDNPAATKAAFTKEGWFMTGDIVDISTDGYIKIIDRKKELLVLSNGKKIAPLSIEKDLKSSRYISQVVVIGESRNYLIALIVPNFELIKEYLKHENDADIKPAELVKDERVVHLFRSIIDKKMSTQAPYKQIKKFILLDKEFSQDEGELTPTLKIKRQVIAEKYHSMIEEKYKEVERSDV